MITLHSYKVVYLEGWLILLFCCFFIFNDKLTPFIKLVHSTDISLGGRTNFAQHTFHSVNHLHLEHTFRCFLIIPKFGKAVVCGLSIWKSVRLHASAQHHAFALSPTPQTGHVYLRNPPHFIKNTLSATPKHTLLM